MRVGFAESVAYRGEMVVWVLATTMPLVMVSLWTSVASNGAVTGQNATWTSERFVAYFLCIFLVRQLIASWACWEINFEVRQGMLSMRLLRPIHPVLSYLVGNIAYMPLRLVVVLPVAVWLVVGPSWSGLSHDWRVWVLWVFSMVGGWAINFFANVLIGSLCLFMESSVKLMDVWLAGFFVFSGYLFPLDLFPEWLRWAATWLPFRYQIGLPVELMTNVHDFGAALELVARQWAWVAGFVVTSLGVWRVGVRRFQAYGG
ncbi:MAG: ABC-2 family transporter protein [Archangium sp.]|nr:ABC-2 family transporter protein [Archangium sp.]